MRFRHIIKFNYKIVESVIIFEKIRHVIFEEGKYLHDKFLVQNRSEALLQC